MFFFIQRETPGKPYGIGETGIVFHATDNESLSPLVYRGAGPAVVLDAAYRHGFALVTLENLFSSIDLTSSRQSRIGAVLSEDLPVMSSLGAYVKVMDSSFGRLYTGGITDVHVEMYRLTADPNGFEETEIENGVDSQLEYAISLAESLASG
ncbi:MAG: hypothetical protein ACOC2H_08655 [Spirochaetota bacterium]